MLDAETLRCDPIGVAGFDDCPITFSGTGFLAILWGFPSDCAAPTLILKHSTANSPAHPWTVESSLPDSTIRGGGEAFREDLLTGDN